VIGACFRLGEEGLTDHQRLNRHVEVTPLCQSFVSLCPDMAIWRVDMNGEQVGGQTTLTGDVVPSVVIHNEQVGIIETDVIITSSLVGASTSGVR